MSNNSIASETYAFDCEGAGSLVEMAHHLREAGSGSALDHRCHHWKRARELAELAIENGEATARLRGASDGLRYIAVFMREGRAAVTEADIPIFISMLELCRQLPRDGTWVQSSTRDRLDEHMRELGSRSP